MTERGLPIAEGAACPFVAFDDARDDRSDRPDPRHRCYAESPPSPRARAHQEAYCLSANFPVCPTFQDWARREAARVLPTAAGGSPADRLRDIPAQREAGTRPPAFGTPAGVPGDAPSGERSAITGRSPADLGTGPDPSLSPATPEPVDAFRGRDVDEDQADESDVRHGDLPHGDTDEGHAAWDLPPRRQVQPGWTSPPPWAASRGSADVEQGTLSLSRDPASAAHDDAAWSRRPADDAHADHEDDEPSDPREASLARLRGLGIGDAGDPRALGHEDIEDIPVTRTPRPAVGLGRALPGDSADRSVPVGRGTVIEGTGFAPDPDAAGARPGGATGDGERRASGSLGRLLGFDRRPKAGSPRATRKPEKEPAWERPRRFEAYPTLKTRVGVPMPSRLWLAAGAVVVAALILFFVPPLQLKQPNTGGPGPTRTPGESGAPASGAVASPVRSVAPTAKPSPTQQTYAIKQGDTLSSIAKKFHTTVDEILATNKNIKNPNKIAVGDIIVIPAAAPSEVIDSGTASP